MKVWPPQSLHDPLSETDVRASWPLQSLHDPLCETDVRASWPLQSLHDALCETDVRASPTSTITAWPLMWNWCSCKFDLYILCMILCAIQSVENPTLRSNKAYQHFEILKVEQEHIHTHKSLKVGWKKVWVTVRKIYVARPCQAFCPLTHLC